MSMQLKSLEAAFSFGKKIDKASHKPANDNQRLRGRDGSHKADDERFPKVDDIVDRLTEKSSVTDEKNG